MSGSLSKPLAAGARGNSRKAISPLGAVARGLVAGAAGTCAMDALWFSRGTAAATARSDSAGGSLIGRRELGSGAGAGSGRQAAVRGPVQAPAAGTRVALVNNITHWAYGMLGRRAVRPRRGLAADPRIRYGLPFGASVWAAGYACCPPPSCTSRSGSTTGHAGQGSERPPRVRARNGLGLLAAAAVDRSGSDHTRNQRKAAVSLTGERSRRGDRPLQTSSWRP